ncbi:MAG: hypothetical protein ABIG95_01885, partial [Candidatus Woesearchaeota archaeon]
VGTMVIGGITLYFGIETVLGYVTDKFFDQELVQVNAQQPPYPNEQSIELIIDDKKGLGDLRELTAKGKLMEWGTFLSTHPDRTRTIIDYILPPQTAKEKRLIGLSSPYMLLMDVNRAAKEGYQGCHHYHSARGAGSYWVSKGDRLKPYGWINLLTFMRRGEPEVIGYNYQYPSIFLPSDDSKSKFMLASPEQVMDFLAR